MRGLIAALALISLGAFGHSVEPGYLTVPMEEDRAAFYVNAVNRFDHKKVFVVETFADRDARVPVSVLTTPRKFALGPNASTGVWVFVEDFEHSFVYVCTRTLPDIDQGVSMATRVCSKVFFKRQS